MTFEHPLGYQPVPLSEFVAAKRNPKGHDLEEIKNSIRRWGFVTPVACDARLKKPTLVAGHGRVEALREMQAAGEDVPGGIALTPDGEWHVPNVFAPFASRKEAEAYLLADNRLTELGAWDDGEQLAAMLAELDGNFEGTGFTERDVEDLANALADVAPPSVTVGDPSAIGSRFELVVECVNEENLRTLFEQMEADGYTCRTLIL